jgi:hypothetical protein
MTMRVGDHRRRSAVADDRSRSSVAVSWRIREHQHAGPPLRVGLVLQDLTPAIRHAAEHGEEAHGLVFAETLVRVRVVDRSYGRVDGVEVRADDKGNQAIVRAIRGSLGERPLALSTPPLQERRWTARGGMLSYRHAAMLPEDGNG